MRQQQLKITRECENQRNRYHKLLEEGCELIEDVHGLEQSIGQMVELDVTVDGFTQKGLVRFYIKGETNPKAFHLLIPLRVLNYNNNISFNDLKEGSELRLQFIVGVRMATKDGFVISLRLPQ
jgi:hypothetical protein